MGDLNDKMQMTFNIFDQDTDGIISREDIRFIMSHIPFVRSIDGDTPNSLQFKLNNVSQEGKYDSKDGKITLYKDRVNDMMQINIFLDKVFD